jgi:nucleoside phosphorylase
MVRTQVLSLPIDDAGAVSDPSEIFTELTRPWSTEECAVPLRLSQRDVVSNSYSADVGVMLVMLAERLAHGNTGERASVIAGEAVLRELVIALWRGLPPQIRRSLTFGFSFSPADLKHRSLHLACFPKSLQTRWDGHPNLLHTNALSSEPSTGAAYLLGLPGGEVIRTFAKQADLPEPQLHELGAYERVARDWDNRPRLNFEGWASVVLGLVALAPLVTQAVEVKRISVEQAAHHLRPFVADDILCLRGFKMSALGETVCPISDAVSAWFQKCFAGNKHEAIKALVAVLGKLKTDVVAEWKRWVLEGLRAGFVSAPRTAHAIIWDVWYASDEVFDVVSPTTLEGADREENWIATVPQKVPPILGEKILAWCSKSKWWQMHAATALAFLPWETVIQRQLAADRAGIGIEPIRLICARATAPIVVRFAIGANDPRVLDCAAECCIAHPETFAEFDPRNSGWLDLLTRAITQRNNVLHQLQHGRAMLYSVLDFILEGGAVPTSILDAFAGAGFGDLTKYSRRAAVWLKLPSASRKAFLQATALGWLKDYFTIRQDASPPETDLRATLLGADLHGLRFSSTTPSLIARGLDFFRMFSDASEELFQEWLETVSQSLIQLSSSQVGHIVNTIKTNGWENAAKTIQHLAAQSRRSNLASIWQSYWTSLSRQEKLLWRMDSLVAAKIKQTATTFSSTDFSMTPSRTSENVVALFLTALGLEFRAVRSHLTNVHEKTLDNVVYGVGTFHNGPDNYIVAIAQTGIGNVEAATLTERAIKHFAPRYAFFVGIAGGLKDELKLGDVVIADKVYAYESGKAEKEFKPRPKAPIADFASTQRAYATMRDEQWTRRIKTKLDNKPAAYVKPVAAGEKIIDSHYSEVFALIKETYSDAYAVAMEEFGFFYAVHLNRTVIGSVIRGISDFSENKSRAEKQKSQELSADNAAAFAFEMLAGFCSSDAAAVEEPLDYRHL